MDRTVFCDPNLLPYELQRRFWLKVITFENEDQCWIWKEHTNPAGYGQLTYNCKTYYSHIISWIIHNNQLTNGLYVLHTCDIKDCTNSKHLFLGTHNDNMKDMVRKGRQAKGENNGYAKLTEIKVKEIRLKYATGKYFQYELAEEYDTSQSNICDVVNYKYWK